MDSERFDAVIRALGTGTSRRGMLGLLCGALGLGFDRAAGRRQRNAKGDRRKRGRARGDGGKGKRGQERGQRAHAEAACCSTGNCTPGPGKNLCRCCYQGQDLSGKNFKGANLGSANFSDATLTGANLQGANAGDACFVDADLRGMRTNASTNLAGAIFCRTQTDAGENNSGCTKGTACCPTCDDAHPCGGGQVCCNGRCRECCGDGVQSTCGVGQLCCRGTCRDSDWANQTTFGSGPGAGGNQFDTPQGMTVSADGLTALVADRNNSRVSVWTRPHAASLNWSPHSTFGSFGAGDNQFTFPRDVALAADELTAWVGDLGNNRVSVWTRPNAGSTNWSPLVRFGGGPGSGDNQFNFPRGVAVSQDQLTVWVVDGGNNRISVWNRPNATSLVWSPVVRFGTGPGNGANQFSLPRDIALSEDELTVLVADGGNNRISVWTRPNAGSTTWTPHSTFGSGPGNGANQFTIPHDVAVSADTLTAWVADEVNNRISIWTRPNAASTNWSPLERFGSGPASGANRFNGPRGVALADDEATVWVADAVNNRISVWGLACPA